MSSDEQLMLAASGGDLTAFGKLVTRHQRSAWNAAYRFLGNAADAEDAVQEAFLKILDSAERYQPTASFRTYLFRVITRLCLDQARRKRVRRHQQLPELAAACASPDGASLLDERAAAVREALDALSPPQKMAVILRYYENSDYREIAAALDTTPKAAERLLARARATLAGRLHGFLEE